MSPGWWEKIVVNLAVHAAVPDVSPWVLLVVVVGDVVVMHGGGGGLMVSSGIRGRRPVPIPVTVPLGRVVLNVHLVGRHETRLGLVRIKPLSHWRLLLRGEERSDEQGCVCVCVCVCC